MNSNLHTSFDIPRGALKFRELILHVSLKSVRDIYFGAVKLNKILYYSDFRSFERIGFPITGVKYFKLQQGPAPRALIPTRRELIEEGALLLEKRDLGNGFIQDRTIALRSPALSLFTSDELSVVDEVIDDLRGQTAEQISDASHDVRWRAVSLKDDIPYEFVYLSDAELSESDKGRTSKLVREFGW